MLFSHLPSTYPSSAFHTPASSTSSSSDPDLVSSLSNISSTPANHPSTTIQTNSSISTINSNQINNLTQSQSQFNHQHPFQNHHFNLSASTSNENNHNIDPIPTSDSILPIKTNCNNSPLCNSQSIHHIIPSHSTSSTPSSVTQLTNQISSQTHPIISPQSSSLINSPDPKLIANSNSVINCPIPANNTNNISKLSLASTRTSLSSGLWSNSITPNSTDLINPFTILDSPIPSATHSFLSHNQLNQHRPDFLINNSTSNIKSCPTNTSHCNSSNQNFHSTSHSPPCLMVNRPYQNFYNYLNPITSPKDSSTFSPPIIPHLATSPHHHRTLTVWNGGFDSACPTTFYDPFQIKHRRRTTPAQLGVLEAQFDSNCKPDVVLRKQLADQLDMTPREVQVWFQNRRAKTKKLEKKAEQDSGQTGESELNRPPSSPPPSVYLSTPSSCPLNLPVIPDNQHDLRPDRSPLKPVVLTSENEKIDLIAQGRFEAERRNRSQSLHHHQHHHHPYYHVNSNLYTEPSGSVGPLFATRAFTELQQPLKVSEPGDERSTTINSERRDSRTSSIASSTLTASDSNLVHTPPTTEFGIDMSFPDGYDPGRRSSCPADFIQSFDHCRLNNVQLPGLSIQSVLESSILGAQQTNRGGINDKVALEWLYTPPQAIPEAQNGCESGWDGLNDWKADNGREGIQRRHSLASMSPSLAATHTDNSIETNEQTHLVCDGLFPILTPYPSKITGMNTNTVLNNGPRGYGRRASTSVLNSIEEHPGNLWNS
ncbi:hypothetical protein O181_053037 [Austropuccinia psidii MF-1]|uniref:Homeobox domain-containing protein n=1 Tax=Austropuccinia psidii MF-1 TaxID=1389203 RepID=A0A9Q3E450_9BASI|nr:hypothetical protein [Austropuccinia psidii MF-1]